MEDELFQTSVSFNIVWLVHTCSRYGELMYNKTWEQVSGMCCTVWCACTLSTQSICFHVYSKLHMKGLHVHACTNTHIHTQTSDHTTWGSNCQSPTFTGTLLHRIGSVVSIGSWKMRSIYLESWIDERKNGGGGTFIE